MRKIKKSQGLEKFRISDREFLNKKLQPCVQYAKVKSKINSGFNAAHQQEIEKEIRKYYKVKNDEVFRRISLSELLQLMIVYAEECQLININSDCKLPSEVSDVTKDHNNTDMQPQTRISDKVIDPPVESLIYPCPFLILDVRAASDYNKGHLATAVNHPREIMAQAFNWECQAMLLYKNHPEWIIIICDENENISSEVANVLIHRGYTNSFVLSGGMRLARDKIGSPLVTVDQEKLLSNTLVDYLCEKLSSLILSSTTAMEEPSSWWNKTHSRQSSQDSGIDQAGLERMRNRSRSVGEGKLKNIWHN